jgi:hypothetical protein
MDRIVLFATSGDLPGEIDLQWDSIPGSKAYAVQYRRNIKKTKWNMIDITDESHYTITGLKSKKEYIFRVAAIYNNKQGDWCKAVTKKVI